MGLLDLPIDNVNQQWIWPKNDNGLWQIISSEWFPLKKMWLKHIKNFDVCVQAGGNMGLYPRLFSEMFGKVYTFEPNPLSFYCLTNNCQKENVYKFNSALSSKVESLKIKTKGLCNLGEVRINKEEGDKEVIALTVDTLHLKKCDFIQLDVEGFEYQALEGAFYTIIRNLPVISVENGNNEIEYMLKKIDPRYEHVDSFGNGTDRSDDVYKIV